MNFSPRARHPSGIDLEQHSIPVRPDEHPVSIRIEVPLVAPYVARTPSSNDVLREPPSDRPSQKYHGILLSKHIRAGGLVSFNVQSSASSEEQDNVAETKDVNLESVLSHVTPEALERFEHHHSELDHKRRELQRRVGRHHKTFADAERGNAHNPAIYTMGVTGPTSVHVPSLS
ncbi:MAG: hypothetical protein L6R38_009448 [Xanthoria sp. 2 TBL-2021]|nr:MAG: hypothetical protein L6R38_009448 [Xanthoria sp. 2 TBL-2021]